MHLTLIRWSDIVTLFRAPTLRTPRPRTRACNHPWLERLEDRALLSAMSGEKHSPAPAAVAAEGRKFDAPNVAGVWTITGDEAAFSGILAATQKGKKVSGTVEVNFGTPANKTINFKNAKFKKHSPNVLSIKGTIDDVPVDIVFIIDNDNQFHGNLKFAGQTFTFTGEGAHP